MKNLTQRHGDTESWPKVRLGDVCELLNPKVMDYGELPILDARFLRGQSEPKYSNKGKLIESGDFLILVDGENSGEVFCAPSKGYLGSTFKGLKIARSSFSTYVLYFIASHKDSLRESKTGSAIPHLNKEIFFNLEIPLPPLSVQREIVARLEKELASVDRMVKGFEAMKAEADQLFKSTLKETFEDIKRRGAETRRLGEVCDVITDGDHQPPPKSREGIPFLVISNVVKGRLDFSDTRYVPRTYYEAIDAKRKPRKGDLLLTVTGSFGVPVLVETERAFCFQRHIALLRCSTEDVSFLRYLLLSPDSFAYFDKVATGAAQRTVSLSSLRDMNVSLPSLATQREVVAKLDAAREKCVKLKSAAEEGLKTAALLRKAILKEAFE